MQLRVLVLNTTAASNRMAFSRRPNCQATLGRVVNEQFVDRAMPSQ